jgi:hypothetical protein
MKKLFAITYLAAIYALCLAATTNMAYAEAVKKQVCKDKVDKAGKPVMDKKTGKPAQECKTIRVHQKFEGTEIPEDKKKK